MDLNVFNTKKSLRSDPGLLLASLIPFTFQLIYPLRTKIVY